MQEADCLTYQESPDMSGVMTIFFGGLWQCNAIGHEITQPKPSGKRLRKFTQADNSRIGSLLLAPAYLPVRQDTAGDAQKHPGLPPIFFWKPPAGIYTLVQKSGLFPKGVTARLAGPEK